MEFVFFSLVFNCFLFFWSCRGINQKPPKIISHLLYTEVSLFLSPPPLSLCLFIPLMAQEMTFVGQTALYCTSSVDKQLVLNVKSTLNNYVIDFYRATKYWLAKTQHACTD